MQWPRVDCSEIEFCKLPRPRQRYSYDETWYAGLLLHSVVFYFGVADNSFAISGAAVLNIGTAWRANLAQRICNGACRIFVSEWTAYFRKCA